MRKEDHRLMTERYKAERNYLSRGAARSESTEADALVMDCVFEGIGLSPENGERSAEKAI